jgi:Ca2+:H+ antiporter
MASERRPIVSYLFPIGSVALAAAIRVSGVEVENGPLWVEVSVPLVAVCVLLTTVFVVLHHAETVASRLGEPYGTLLLTFAITTIEVSIIVSMMLHGQNNPTLARESVFSTVMIVCAGVVGLCLTLGGLRHYRQDLMRQGTSAFLAVLTALAALTLVLPNFTLATSPGAFSAVQLAFVSMCSVLLYAGFVFAQTVRHRDDFVEDLQRPDEEAEAEVVSSRATIVSAVLLFVGLVGIVLLAEQVAIGVENGLDALHVGQTDAIVGALIATLVLLPESLSAIRAALNNELQRSLNVALGSALATIGLTIPAVATASLVTGRELTLGLLPRDVVLLVLVLSVSTQSFGTGRTTMLTGLVHLTIFIAYVLLIAVP